jgi:hypothetical protein
MKKENDFIINRTSKEFPMKTFYGNINPVNQKAHRPIIKLFPDLRNGFNNESPDFFRMDSMRENETSYKNPYLNVVKTVNRSLFYKNNQSCIDHIKLINKVKSKKELSQNPKILKQICYSTDINILENNLHKESKTVPYMYRTINSNFDDPEYVGIIKTLDKEYGKTHNFILKNSFNMNKVNENQMSTYENNNNYNNNNNYTFYNDRYKNEGSEEKKIPHDENDFNINNITNNNPPIQKNFRNTTIAFNKFNKDNINEDDMERGVEKNMNMNFMTMYPKAKNENDIKNNFCNYYYIKFYYVKLYKIIFQ